jgi:hypothetical protein
MVGVVAASRQILDRTTFSDRFYKNFKQNCIAIPHLEWAAGHQKGR